MSIASTIARTTALGNGITSTYSWGAWQIDQESDLHVAVLSNASPQVLTTLTLNVDYVFVTPALSLENSNGGSIQLTNTGFLAPYSGNLPTGWGIVLRRAVTFGQPAVLSNQSGFQPASVEDMADYLSMQILQLQDAMAHVVQLPLDDYTVAAQNIGLASARASQFVAFDAYGNPISSPGPMNTSAPSTLGAELLTAANSTAALAALGLTVGITGGELLAAGSPQAAEIILGFVSQSSGANTVGGTQTYTGMAIGGNPSNGMVMVWSCPATNTQTTVELANTGYNTYQIIHKSGGAVSAGDLVNGTFYLLAFDGSSWRIMA